MKYFIRCRPRNQKRFTGPFWVSEELATKYLLKRRNEVQVLDYREEENA